MSSSRRPYILLLALMVGLAGPVKARTVAPDEADEQYQFIAGLTQKGMHEVAVREALIFLQRYPRHEKAELTRYRLASSLYELDRLGEAADEYRRLAERRGFEFEAEVHFRLGQCELQGGRAARAASAFARVLELDKDYLRLPSTFFLGEAFFQQGDFKRAAERYEEAIAADKEREYARDAAYGLAWCAFRLGDSDDAVRRIEGFLRAHPRDPAATELRFLLGEAHLAAGRPGQAHEAYRAVADGEFHEAALRGAAFALAEMGEHQRAAGAFEKALERYPEGQHAGEVALHAGVEWLRAGEPQRAIDALSRDAVGRGPEALYWRGRAQLRAGDAEGALASIDAALAPGSGQLEDGLRDQLHVARGDALAELGRGDEAVRSYSRSSSEYALYAAAVEALNEGRTAESVRLAASLIEARPDTRYRAELQLILGEGLLAENRHERAAEAFLAAVDLARKAPSTAAGEAPTGVAPRGLSRAGWCYYLAGDYTRGAELFTRVVRDYTASPEAEESFYMLGRCHEAAGESEAAVRALRAYVERFPEGARRGEALMSLARLEGDDGSRWLEEALRHDGSTEHSAYALFELGERDAKAGKTDEALARYGALLERYPEDANAPAALYGIGWCLYDAGRYADAAPPLEQLVRERRADAELQLAAGELLVWTWSKAGDGDRARAAYEGFAKKCEDDGRCWEAAKVAAGALVAADRPDDAKAVYDSVLARVRDPHVALEVLVEGAWLALDAGRVDEADAGVRTALRVAERRELDGGPRLAEACFFVGEARFDAGQHRDAAELFAEAAARSEDGLVAQALYMQGFAYLRLEDWEGASAAFSALVEGHGGHPLYGEGVYLLGESHFRAGRFDAAADVLARLPRELPKHEATNKALFRLGVALGELERWKEAETALSALLRRDPEFEHAPEADLWRGRALAARGDARAARAAYQRVLARTDGVMAARARIGVGRLSLDGGDPEAALSEFLKVALLYANEEEVAEALFLAGSCLEQLGDVDRALEQYRELLDDYPKTTHARAARERLRELGNE